MLDSLYASWSTFSFVHWRESIMNASLNNSSNYSLYLFVSIGWLSLCLLSTVLLRFVEDTNHAPQKKMATVAQPSPLPSPSSSAPSSAATASPSSSSSPSPSSSSSPDHTAISKDDLMVQQFDQFIQQQKIARQVQQAERAASTGQSTSPRRSPQRGVFHATLRCFDYMSYLWMCLLRSICASLPLLHHLVVQPIGMVDFAVFECPEDWTLSHERFGERMKVIYHQKQAKLQQQLKQQQEKTQNKQQDQSNTTPTPSSSSSSSSSSDAIDTSSFTLDEATQSALDFQLRLIQRSGVGSHASWPPGILNDPPYLNGTASKEEAQAVIFGAIDNLIAKTHINLSKVDILIVNCSLFNPTPSLAAMIANKYKMRSDLESYNLSGMGCSAGLISLHLAKNLLTSSKFMHKPATALVVSTEIISQCLYTGTERKKLLQNVLFRCGAAASLLTNSYADRWFGRMKYSLNHTIRTNLSADDVAYRCVWEDEDKEGCGGVSLEKELMQVATKGLQKNITTLGPLILPYSEILKYGFYFVLRIVDQQFRLLEKLDALGICLFKDAPQIIAQSSSSAPSTTTTPPTTSTTETAPKPLSKAAKYSSRVPSYIPNFKKAVSHFCIHAGGRAVIDAIQSALKLEDIDVESSRFSLYRYGNTSSSSVWYELNYLEQQQRVKKGDKVWQLGFGSGFKCNSAVWQKL